MIEIIIYSVGLILLLIYSYSLVDPNLTLVNHPVWTWFRNQMVYLGYYQRPVAWILYLILITFLFIIHYYLLTKHKKFDAMKIAILIAIILLISYPFLSHDFFNYLFDAKILTVYGQNPYLHKPLDFSTDPWLRFMHWTHRSYPYGPTFLLLSLIPSWLSLGKFILNFLFFKLMIIGFYLLAVFYLYKIDKKQALLFATHPLAIIEGLVNSHNDLIAVSLGIAGIYYLLRDRNIIARILLLISGGIKYTTLPLIIMSKKYKQLNNGAIITILLLIVYLSLFREIQPWYFLTLFVFIPFFPQLINRLIIFFFGLLISYYPYIRFGGWDEGWKVNLKHQIILVFLILNVIYILFGHFSKPFKKASSVF